MKNPIRSLLTIGLLAACALMAQFAPVCNGQTVSTNASGGTTTVTGPTLSTIIGSGGWQSTLERGLAYLENNGTTNGIVTTEAGVLIGNHKDIGGFLDVYLPIGGTNSVFGGGFGLAYLNRQFYNATLNARLGDTINLPLIRLPVYTYIESGGGYNIGKNAVIAQAFAGFSVQIPISATWSASAGAAIGTISDYTGNVEAIGGSVTWRF